MLKSDIKDRSYMKMRRKVKTAQQNCSKELQIKDEIREQCHRKREIVQK